MRNHNPSGRSPFLYAGLYIFIVSILLSWSLSSVQPVSARNAGEEAYQSVPTAKPTSKPRRKPTRTPTIIYIPPTETLTPTITSEPTETPSATPSPSPTETLIPTETPTDQPTLVPAPTSTPLPIQEEAVSQISINALGIGSLVMAGLGLLLLVWNIRRSLR